MSGKRLRALARNFAQPEARILFAMGFGCGLPFLLVGPTLSIWLRESGMSLGAIGLVAYTGLFYVFKFLWAPLLDRWQAPGLAHLGRRRGWLLAAQLLLMAGLGGLALLGLDTAALTAFVVLLAITAFAGATQDTVVDAYRIEIAPLDQQGTLAATYSLGYRIGLITGGAGALYVAEFWGWRVAYLAMALLLLPAMLATLLAREPAATEPLRREPLLAFMIGPFVAFFRRFGWVLALALLAFVGLYKLPDQMLGVLAGPFYLDTGFSKADIANVSKLYGVWIGICGGFAGAFAVSAWGHYRSLLVAAVAVALSNLLFILMAFHPGELWAFVMTISGDNFSQGFAGVVLVAFMSGLTNRSFTATQYALLSALANLPGKLIGGVSGFIVEAWGYVGFFSFSAVSILPTLLLLAWLHRRAKAGALAS